MLRNPFQILPIQRKEINLTNHALTVQTAPRPNGTTLESTLDSLKKAGLDQWAGPKVIAADGYVPAVSDWELTCSETKLGSAKTFFRLLREIVTRWPRIELVTFCEDDIVLAKNALLYIGSVQIPRGVSLIAWFTPYQLVSKGPELQCFHNKDFYYSQMVTMSRSLVAQILRKESKWTEINGPDILMSRCGFRCAVHCPNIANHVGGTNSACGYSWWGPRQSISFVGEDFDSLNL